MWGNLMWGNLQDIEWPAIVALFLLVALLSVIVFAATASHRDHKTSRVEVHPLLVVDKFYTGESSSIGVGPVVGGDGGVAITVNGEDEKYTLQIEGMGMIQVHEQTFLKAERGKRQNFKIRIGGNTNSILNLWI